MSLCVIEFPAITLEATFSPATPTEVGVLLAAVLAQSTVITWEISDLAPGRRANRLPADELAKIVSDYVISRKELFAGVDIVAIEAQMNGRMRCVTFALAGALRAIGCDFTFQGAVMKLKWPEIGWNHVDGTYAQRKNAAVQMVGSACAQCEPLATRFASEKKKDDMADSMLHCLRCFVTRISRRRDRSGGRARTSRNCRRRLTLED